MPELSRRKLLLSCDSFLHGLVLKTGSDTVATYCNALFSGTLNDAFLMDVWLSNHFPCQDLVQHPMETTIKNCDVWSSRLDRSVVPGAPNVLQHQI